jgi:hypothetical protein
MNNVRLPRALCAVVGDVLLTTGSHATLDSLFRAAGAPGDPPDLSHASKWKDWLFRAGNDPEVDSLAVLGNVLEEFMDLAPEEWTDAHFEWQSKRDRIVSALEESGFRYFRGGRVLPNGVELEKPASPASGPNPQLAKKPDDIDELLLVLLKGLRRAMHPLTHRRKGAQSLSFQSEYDVQDLLHALLRPWVTDIRPEEFTPSYAGTSTRMDFLLPAHELVIEMKFVRDRAHARKIGDELIIDIEHYRRHQSCERLWCVIYDPEVLLPNAEGLKQDLEGDRQTADGKVSVKVLVL